MLSLFTKNDRPWRTSCSNRNASIKFHEEEKVKGDTFGDAIKMKSILYLSNLLIKRLKKGPRKAGDKKRHRSFLALIYFDIFLLQSKSICFRKGFKFFLAFSF